MVKKGPVDKAYAEWERGEVVDVFASGVRGQESVRLDLQFPGVECTAAEDMARQEYKLESDIQYQLARFGQGMPHQHGEFDFDRADLQQALAAVEEAAQAFGRLPKLVRDRYRSWAAVEAAARTGELEQLLKVAGVNADVSALAPAASPSGSAADGSSNS